MVKKTQAKAKNQRPAKTAKKKPEKQTIEKLSDQERQKILFAHKRKLVPLLLAEKEAKGAVTKAYELAKKEGVPKIELRIAIALQTDDGSDTYGKEIERIARVARWMNVPLGAQLDMFGADKRKPAEKYFEDGRIAALDDQSRKPPSHIAQNMTDHWFEGYDVGRKAMNTERAQGFKTLGDVAKSLIPANGNDGERDGDASLPLGGAEAVDSLVSTH